MMNEFNMRSSYVQHFSKEKVGAVYLSLGDKEKNTRNPIMSTVGDCISKAYEHLKEKGLGVCLEWDQGNHFKDADIRTAKAFSWTMEH